MDILTTKVTIYVCEYCGDRFDDFEAQGSDVKQMMIEHQKKCKIKHNGIKDPDFMKQCDEDQIKENKL